MTELQEWDFIEPDITNYQPICEYIGLVEGLSNEQYHAHKSISKSGLDEIARSPAHYQAYISEERIETNTFADGTLLHCAILEPDEFDSRYYAIPEKLDLRTKIGKDKKSEYDVKANGRILITVDDMKMAKGVIDSVYCHSRARKFLSLPGISEASIFSELCGIPVRCRPDRMSIDSGLIIDLKSIEDVRTFKRSVEKYRYYVQDPFYRDVADSEGIGIEFFIFIVVEKKPPYGIGIFQLDDDAVNAGRAEYMDNLDTYKRCLDSGLWPGYPEEVKTLTISKYITDK